MPGQLDPAYHPTADGAVKLIPHRGDPAAADDIRATFTALTSPVLLHGQPGGPALASLADLPAWLAQRADPDDDPDPGPGTEPEPEPEEPTSGKAPSGLTAEAAARRYMALGWPVFVLGRSKRPVANCHPCHKAGRDHDKAACECLTCHGFYAATTRPRPPGRDAPPRARGSAGHPHRPCLRAVRGRYRPAQRRPARPRPHDPDRHRGDRRGRLAPVLPPPRRPATVPALPGAGRGGHQGDGGYVAAPPSIHPGTGKPYRWVGGRGVAEMPPALRAALLPPPPPAAPAVALHGPVRPCGAGGISSPPALLAALLRAVQNAPEGRRRATLYGAARGAARMVTAGRPHRSRGPRRAHRGRDRRPADPP